MPAPVSMPAGWDGLTPAPHSCFALFPKPMAGSSPGLWYRPRGLTLRLCREAHTPCPCANTHFWGGHMAGGAGSSGVGGSSKDLPPLPDWLCDEHPVGHQEQEATSSFHSGRHRLAPRPQLFPLGCLDHMLLKRAEHVAGLSQAGLGGGWGRWAPAAVPGAGLWSVTWHWSWLPRMGTEDQLRVSTVW